MESERANNYACLCGTAAAEPAPSHENRGVAYYRMPLEVRRLSGTVDRLNVILPRPAALGIYAGARLRVQGDVRSYNNRSGVGSRLVITVLARRAEDWNGEDENVVCLTGALCRMPTARSTPLGREICDLMLAVNRPYGRADYLPCIAWGESAAAAAELKTGDMISLSGRLQSRAYIKCVDGRSVEKTAFEISIMAFAPMRERRDGNADIM